MARERKSEREREKVREREFGERYQASREKLDEELHGQWIKVSKRKPSTLKTLTQPKSATKTSFVAHLPPDTQPSDLLNLFKKYGRISAIAIPPLPNPNFNHRFAFIRFADTQAMNQAILEMNGIKLEGRILVVQPAKNDMKNRHQSHPAIQPPQTHHNKPKIHQNQKLSHRDHRSYKEVFQSRSPQKKPNPNSNSQPPTKNDLRKNPNLEHHLQEEPQPEFLH